MIKIIIGMVVLLLSLPLGAANSLTGKLSILYGDNFGANTASIKKYELITTDGVISLDVSDKFLHTMPLFSWQGKNVKVTFKENSNSSVQVITLKEGKANLRAVNGSQPWVSILCKFSDINAEPKNLSYFQGLYSNNPGGLDHFWREASYDAIDTVGSSAVDWVNLPSPQTTYIATPGSSQDANLNLLFDDCTAAADPFVNFADSGNGSPYVGINMMFNDVLDCCAWGGGHWANLDGVSKVWSTTWEPPWGYGNAAILAHEMGHGFGLPHSNNSDGDSSPYDTPWGVMSAASVNSVNDATYGARGKHITMTFKWMLGWVLDADGFIANNSTYQSLIIDRTSLASTSNYRFAKIPLQDGTYYMIEARKKVGEYDANLPGEAIIINHVDNSRNEPPWIVDKDIPPADFSDNEGVMWKVGETFLDTIDGFSVEILSTTAEGFEIRIIGPNAASDLIFADSFE